MPTSNPRTGAVSPILRKEDKKRLELLNVSAAAIIEVYDAQRASGLNHSEAMAEVFNAFGTAPLNQGLYRSVVAAHNRARKHRKVPKESSPSVSNESRQS